MTFSRTFAGLLTAGLIQLSAPVCAEIDLVSFIWHNDAFVDRDGGGYTNGAYISLYDLSTRGNAEFSKPLLVRPFHKLLMMPERNPLYEVKGTTLGQIMVTPSDIKVPDPDPDDAPYAGLAFFRSSYFAVYEDYVDTLSVTLGIVGPSSGAQQTQRFVHKMIGVNDPEGWHHQLRDEPVAQVARGRIWRYANDRADGTGTDLLLLGNMSVGNLESGIGTGVILRYGTELRSSYVTAAQMTGRMSNPMALDGGWNVFVGATAEYLHNQIFVNGNTFRESPSGDLQHGQYSILAGASWSRERLSLTLAFVDGNSLDKKATSRQQFGSIIFGWRFK